MYNLKYRSDPQNWKNANYDKFLEKTIKDKPKVDDPHEILKDRFTDQINFILTDYESEIKAFNRMLAEEREIQIKNEVDFMNQAREFEEVREQIEVKPKEYPMLKKFNLNKEKTGPPAV